ncbi:OB-fold-containig protein [Formosa algae]|uniref:DUF1449 domain-containing protein n=1 Tax=Formosa algae TaxID=225843 RepID=A0A9X0YJ19_9FLAO|nr:OB-fold-containig protein [Formosa algae]MBP1838783.1 hypothetical protein [Formosa algae]MDQ0335283.1 hypothetical protein [Formosa algae]OEI80456.1 hypothetical protein AST99_09165 [Formosa algae]
MTELTNILFSEVNIVLSILLIILILYWIVTMIGGLDFEPDFDFDIDVDIDADVDSGIEGGNMDFEDISNTEINQEDIVDKRRKPLKWWQIFLIYFNFVGLPFMFTFTFWIFVWWFITAITTALTYTYDHFLGFAIMIIAFFPALIVTKVLTNPFKSFFKNLNKDGDAPIDYLGRKATLLSSISEEKMGNAEVKVNGDSMSIYVKSLTGEPLPYGASILIIKRSADHNYYLVQSYNE